MKMFVVLVVIICCLLPSIVGANGMNQQARDLMSLYDLQDAYQCYTPQDCKRVMPEDVFEKYKALEKKFPNKMVYERPHGGRAR
jgi:hypothetical protein